MTRILLADDQQVVRQALRCTLERESDLQVVGETSDGLEIVPLVERLKPDVLITDVAMPGLYGLEVTRRVHEQAPATGVVILSRYPNEWYVTEALRRGALGYVVKQSDVADLLRAVRTVARGRRYLGAPLSDDSIDVWMARANRATADPYDTLTGREHEILQLVAEGYSSTAIARRLTISARTAEAHRANVMRKLRLRNQAALIRYALSRGMLAPVLALTHPLTPGRRDPRGRSGLPFGRLRRSSS
ncbi:MAG TPA: response regulator transcription factor [Candidatus Acidoferrum sp.]|jgi:two-component system, NarL family, response regulator NreC|nr:response regulator transcription factor [Candidatus Acidoferrum sp.]